MTFNARPGQKLVTETPKREGYNFKGWYLDAGYHTAFDNTMPSNDITLYANWERIEVNYTVRHYQENLAIPNENGVPDPDRETTYTLVEEEVFAAPIGKEVTPDVKDYEGFTAPAKKTETVTVDAEGNGTLVIEYQYTRNKYILAWSYTDTDSDTGNDDGIKANVHEYQYGAPITIPDEKEFSIRKNGYRVEGWYTDQNLTQPFNYETMPAEHLVALPKWVAQNIEYYVTYEFLDGALVNYTITETLTGLADSVVEPPEVKTFEGYTFDESTRLQEYKIDPDYPYVDYRYNINTHILTYQYETNSGPVTDSVSKKYGEDITYTPERDGYAFAGWYTDADFNNQYLGTTMPDKNLTLYGKWEYGRQSYQVVHYLTQLDDSKKLYLVENLSENLSETSTVTVTPPSKAPEGYEDVTPKQHTPVAGSVANNRIEYVYPRKQYQVTYHLNGGTSIKETVETLTYEGEINNDPDRAGYQFTGWYLDEALQTPLTDMKMPAHDLDLYAGWRVLKSLYKVEHYWENAETGAYRLAEISYQYADTDSTVEPAVKQYCGYTSPAVQSGIVSGDSANPLTIQYYYNCNKHTLTLHDAVCEDNLSVADVSVEKKYGSSIPAQTRKNFMVCYRAFWKYVCERVSRRFIRN